MIVGLKRGLLVGALSLCTSIAFTATASAASPAGEWRSTSGNVFVIPKATGGRFDVVLVPPKGASRLYQAGWVKGMRGSQFKYGAKWQMTATFNGKNPNKIRVVSTKSKPTMWTRISLPPSRPSAIAGTWLSTTGNRFTIPNNKNTLYVITKYKKSGKKTLSNAQWVKGMRGTQFRYGKGCSATINRRNDTVQASCTSSKGAPSVWTRVGAPAVTRAPKRKPAATGVRGVWQSSAGGTWSIKSASGDRFDAKYTSADGRRVITHSASWSRGLKGTQFQVFKRRDTLTVTLGRSSSKMMVKSARGYTEAWTRLR